MGTYTIDKTIGKQAFLHIADRNVKYINPFGEEFDTIHHNIIVFNLWPSTPFPGLYAKDALTKTQKDFLRGYLWQYGL